MHASRLCKSVTCSNKRCLLHTSRGRNHSHLPRKTKSRKCYWSSTCALFDRKDSQTSHRAPTALPGEPTENTYTGISPGQPDTPQHLSANRSGSFVLALAVFAGAAWGLVTLWKQVAARLTQQRPKVKQTPAPTSDSPTLSRSRRSRKSSRTDPDGLSPRPATPRSSHVICRNFAATGTCRFGDRCRYRHVLEPETLGATTSLHSASPLTTGDEYDSSTESDTEDPVASSSRSQAGAPGNQASGSPYDPSPLQTIKGTYHVPPEQAHNVGRLMGYGGLRIRQICEDTGCCINVGRNTPLGEATPVDIFAENHEGLTEAMRLVSKCFEDDEEDSTDSDSGFESASESDAEEAATEMKPRQPQTVKETYVVSAEMAQKNMGKLMGKGGKNIMAISQFTGCSISVPNYKDRPAGEPVAILVYGEDQARVSETVRLIARCFE